MIIQKSLCGYSIAEALLCYVPKDFRSIGSFANKSKAHANKNDVVDLSFYRNLSFYEKRNSCGCIVRLSPFFVEIFVGTYRSTHVEDTDAFVAVLCPHSQTVRL